MRLTELVRGTIDRYEQDLRSSGGEWYSSPFYSMRTLQIDQRGAVGERICVAILRECGYEVDYEADVTRHHKDYDLLCQGMRIEVKTATRGVKSGTFQHENILRNAHWDGIILLDIAPNNIYVACRLNSEVPWGERDPLWGRCHRRKDSVFYKWDLTVKRHQALDTEVKDIDDFQQCFDAMVQRFRAKGSQ